MYGTFAFDAADGKKIFVHAWTEVIDPVGVIQILHGMGEHSLRYARFAEFLNRNGYLVYADDHRGHGMTAGGPAVYGYLGKDGFNRTVNDVKQLSDIIREKHPGLPLIVFGHSYGSILLQEYVIRYGNVINAALFSGPPCFIRHRAVNSVKAIVPLIMSFALGGRTKNKFIDNMAMGSNIKGITNPRTGYDWLTHDNEIVDKYIADDYCGGVFSINFYRYLSKGIKGISDIKRVRTISKDLPILIMAGTEDPIGEYGVLPKDLADAYTGAGIKDVELKMFEGARHEILNELIFEDVHAYILKWLDRHKRQAL